MTDINERVFQFACRIVLFHQWLARQRTSARLLAGQLLRSSTSIGSNLEEATAGQSKADFVAKARISLKEARESHYWLRILENTRLVPESRVSDLVKEANEIVAILTTIVRKASMSGNRG